MVYACYVDGGPTCRSAAKKKKSFLFFFGKKFEFHFRGHWSLPKNALFIRAHF